MECKAHKFLLGSLEFLDSYRLRHVVVHQAPSNAVAKLLGDDVNRGG
jgi:hypothetical protein